MPVMKAASDTAPTTLPQPPPSVTAYSAHAGGAARACGGGTSQHRHCHRHNPAGRPTCQPAGRPAQRQLSSASSARTAGEDVGRVLWRLAVKGVAQVEHGLRVGVHVPVPQVCSSNGMGVCGALRSAGRGQGAGLTRGREQRIAEGRGQGAWEHVLAQPSHQPPANPPTLPGPAVHLWARPGPCRSWRSGACAGSGRGRRRRTAGSSAGTSTCRSPAIQAVRGRYGGGTPRRTRSRRRPYPRAGCCLGRGLAGTPHACGILPPPHPHGAPATRHPLGPSTHPPTPIHTHLVSDGHEVDFPGLRVAHGGAHSTPLAAWHGMAWHGMAWHGMAWQAGVCASGCGTPGCALRRPAAHAPRRGVPPCMQVAARLSGGPEMNSRESSVSSTRGHTSAARMPAASQHRWRLKRDLLTYAHVCRRRSGRGVA